MPVMAEDLLTLAAKLKKLRDEKVWTQERLANEAKVSLGLIRQIEQGAVVNLKLQSLVNIAAAFGLSAAELLSDVSLPPGELPPRPRKPTPKKSEQESES